MRKSFIVILFVFLLSLLTGCSKKTNEFQQSTLNKFDDEIYQNLDPIDEWNPFPGAERQDKNSSGRRSFRR